MLLVTGLWCGRDTGGVEWEGMRVNGNPQKTLPRWCWW